MAIQKNEYELSIWKEELGDGGQKTETKMFVIGAHDMSYLGRATSVKLTRKINGTNTLSFQMPDKFFDSEKGEYVRNEFADELFAERKIKLKYKDEWYEFFIKKVTDNKKYKSYMKTYDCTDAFIDELSRNGYGITFSEDLYNNVEEIGTFSEEILDGSIWTYHSEHNWGDFTEVLEEKLYKIPTSLFSSISGYKINFNVDIATDKDIINAYTNEAREMEMGDDLAREKKQFWDQQDGSNPLKKNKVNNIEKIAGDYIYIPYSCLNFCYGDTKEPDESKAIAYDRAATEVAQNYPNKSTLAVAPASVDPRTLIQFLVIPDTEKVEIDDAGVIVSKNYSYFMTLDQWNKSIKANVWYMFEDTRLVKAEVLGAADLNDQTISHTYRYIYNYGSETIIGTYKEALGNKAIYYDGYLSDIGENNIIKGKKISISDRTELNISEDIDQYVTIYKDKPSSLNKEVFMNPDWDSSEITDNYRICSKIETRQIIPQLARNLVQNGVDIQSTDGWAPMNAEPSNKYLTSSKIELRVILQSEDTDDSTIASFQNFLYYQPVGSILGLKWSKDNSGTYYNIEDNFYKKEGTTEYQSATINQYKYDSGCTKDNAKPIKNNDGKQDMIIEYPVVTKISTSQGIKNKLKICYDLWPQQHSTYVLQETNLNEQDCSVINFGMIGQDKKIEKGKIYCFGISGITKEGAVTIKIGKGGILSNGNYNLVDSENCLNFYLNSFGTSNSLALQTFWNYADKSGTTIDLGKNSDKLIKNTMTEFYFLFRAEKTIENPYIVIQSCQKILIKDFYLFEAYTKGRDFFENGYYRYSGRNLFGKEDFYGTSLQMKQWEQYDQFGPCSLLVYDDTENIKHTTKEKMKQYILFEDDIMSGSTYEYQQYFIQRIIFTNPKNGSKKYYDTMGAKSYINTKDINENWLPQDEAIYSEDNYEVQTNLIDMNKCNFYNPSGDYKTCDCTYGNGNYTCYYQKFGYCPYRFTPEKHCRRVRTLKGEKSNRFNLIQETSKIFECYPIFYIKHDSNGKVIKNKDGTLDKEIFYMTEKGSENKLGFRYEKNLSNITKTIESDKIVTKLYVLDVDSDLSATGLCSIKTAEDNPTQDSFIIDFSYYLKQGMLDYKTVEEDLYGISSTGTITSSNNKVPQGYLKQLGYYNKLYDSLTNKIINLEDASFTELEANLQVNLTGIETAEKQINKYKQEMQRYAGDKSEEELAKNQAYQNYKSKLAEQEAILCQLIKSTFFTNEIPTRTIDVLNKAEKYLATPGSVTAMMNTTNSIVWFNQIADFKGIQTVWVDEHIYDKGILGQYNKEYNQIQMWKKERASYLKTINEISERFFKKYEPYLKEGTWSDSNYISDNAYYFGALDVAAQGAIPKVSYTISVVDLSSLSEYSDDYIFNIADTSYVEDIGMFGINKRTGLPNRLKILISEITYDLDQPMKNSIKVQNFTTQFEDLFQQVTSSVQSLTYNENIYKRSSNFTSLQNIEKDSLQGTLDKNDLTLLDTSEQNIQVNNTGTSGSDINNHANKYKLNGQGLFFSNDGGEHWNVGVGPSGINADYIKVGTLDAGKIRIADSGYIYFSWDKDGIVALRDPLDPNTNSSNYADFACFNKYGLTLSEKNKIRLRAGYEFTGDNGDITSETAIGEDVGFYLYNTAGQPIFSTETASSESTTPAVDTARITVIGEILATDNIDSAILSKKIYTKIANNISSIKVYILSSLSSEEKIVTKCELMSGQGGLLGSTYYKTVYRLTLQNYDKYVYTFSNKEIGSRITNWYESNNTKTIKTYRSISSCNVDVSNDYSVITIYPENGGTGITAYNEHGQFYYTQIESTSSSQSSVITERVGVFINNKTLASNNDGQQISDVRDKRVFSIIKNDNGVNNNVLTALRNGALFIGGNINSTQSLLNIPDYVEISEPKIILNTNGVIQMDFTKFKDLQGNDLINTISSQISDKLDSLPPHSHGVILNYSMTDGQNYRGEPKIQFNPNDSSYDYTTPDGIKNVFAALASVSLGYLELSTTSEAISPSNKT